MKSRTSAQHDQDKATSNLTVRQAAARPAATASEKTGKPVDERVRKLADKQ